MALIAFATRQYEIAPDVDRLVDHMRHLDDAALKWIALENFAVARDLNEVKIGRKANFLFFSGSTLLVAVLIIGANFIYFLP